MQEVSLQIITNKTPIFTDTAKVRRQSSTYHLLTKSTNSAEKYSAGIDGAAYTAHNIDSNNTE